MKSGNQPGGGNPTGQSSGGGGKTTHDRVQGDLAGLLNRLIRLEFDVAQAYETALHRLDSEDIRAALREQVAERGADIEAIKTRVEALGGKPADTADSYRLLDKARVFFGDIVGDFGILSAMKTNLEELRDSLKAGLDSDGLVAEDREALERAYLSSDRHVRELEELAAKLG